MLDQCLTLSVRVLYILIFCEVYDFFIWFILGSHVTATAEKLDSELSAALDKLRCTKELEQKAEEELRYVAETY